MTEKKIPINEADEEDMQDMIARMDTEAFVKLIDMYNEIDICPYRFRLRCHFGSKVKMDCDKRRQFKEAFENWKEGKK